MSTAKRLRIGVIGRAHGVGGAVRVFSDDEESDSLLYVRGIYVGGAHVYYRVCSSKRCGRFFSLVLEGVNDRDAAFELNGQAVYVERSSLRALSGSDFYACDLVGLVLCDAQARCWGEVVSVQPGGGHDLLYYARRGGGQGCIPFVAAHVGEVDVERGVIMVDGEWMAQIDAIYGE